MVGVAQLTAAWVALALLLGDAVHAKFLQNAVSEDAEEYTSKNYGWRQWTIGEVNLLSTDLEIGSFDRDTNQVTCLYFRGINVPAKSIIENMKLTFVAKVNDLNPIDTRALSLKVWGQYSSSPAVFTADQYDLSTRLRTPSVVDWEIPEGTTYNEMDTFETPNLSSILEDIIARDDWETGNPIVICMSKDGGEDDLSENKRNAHSRDSASQSGPKISITWNEPTREQLISQLPKNEASSLTKSLCYLMYVVGLIIALLATIVVVKWKTHPVIQAAQPKFCLMIIFGAVLSGSSIPFFVVDDSGGELAGPTGGNSAADVACMASVWFFGVGFILMYAALLIKMITVDTVFSLTYTMTASTKKKISARENTKKIMIIVVVEVWLLLMWSVISPLKYYRVAVIDPGTNLSTFSRGYCASEHDTVFLAVVGAYHLLVLMFALRIAIRTTRLHSAFSEGKYMRYSVANGLQFSLLAIPMIAVTQDANTALLMRTGAVALHDIGLLVLLFYPKFSMIMWGLGSNGDGNEGKEMINGFVDKYEVNKSSGTGSSVGSSSSKSGTGVSGSGSRTKPAASMAVSTVHTSELEAQSSFSAGLSTPKGAKAVSPFAPDGESDEFPQV